MDIIWQTHAECDIMASVERNGRLPLQSLNGKNQTIKDLAWLVFQSPFHKCMNRCVYMPKLICVDGGGFYPKNVCLLH